MQHAETMSGWDRLTSMDAPGHARLVGRGAHSNLVVMVCSSCILSIVVLLLLVVVTVGSSMFWHVVTATLGVLLVLWTAATVGMSRLCVMPVWITVVATLVCHDDDTCLVFDGDGAERRAGEAVCNGKK